MNEYPIPLEFRPGNRYEATVYGYRYNSSGTEAVCEKSVEFRAGESQ